MDNMVHAQELVFPWSFFFFEYRLKEIFATMMHTNVTK